MTTREGGNAAKLLIEFNGVLLGDINADGIVDLLDKEPFVQLLVSERFQFEANMNLDGIVDLLDVGPFIDLLNGR